jgi:hypothetical protein
MTKNALFTYQYLRYADTERHAMFQDILGLWLCGGASLGVFAMARVIDKKHGLPWALLFLGLCGGIIGTVVNGILGHMQLQG